MYIYTYTYEPKTYLNNQNMKKQSRIKHAPNPKSKNVGRVSKISKSIGCLAMYIHIYLYGFYIYTNIYIYIRIVCIYIYIYIYIRIVCVYIYIQSERDLCLLGLDQV